MQCRFVPPLTLRFKFLRKKKMNLQFCGTQYPQIKINIFLKFTFQVRMNVSATYMLCYFKLHSWYSSLCFKSWISTASLNVKFWTLSFVKSMSQIYAAH